MVSLWIATNFCSYFQLLVVFMSSEYEQDEAHRTTFVYAKDVLQKPFVIVTVGDDAWKDTELGCAIGPQEVST